MLPTVIEYTNNINSGLIQYVKANPATMIAVTACLGTFIGGVYHSIKKIRLNKKEKINKLENDLRV